jgi:hypothetical protein
MTIGSQESIIDSDGVISQCFDGMSSVKLKNHDVQGDEKYFSTTYVR